jgi:hypothetical protein
MLRGKGIATVRKCHHRDLDGSFVDAQVDISICKEFLPLLL